MAGAAHAGPWRIKERIESLVGGPARLRVITLLALVLGLDTASTGTVGAITVPLQSAFGMSNTDIGLLVTVSTGIGAIATLPCGRLADRVHRVRLLWTAILAWSVAMAASAVALSYTWLLISRVALGAVVAVAGPVVASLIGDMFAPGERGRIYGFVLSGELLGSAVGLVVSGDIATYSWRLAFGWLAVAGVVLAVVVGRLLIEPARGGQSRIHLGARSIDDATAPPERHDSAGRSRDESLTRRVLRQGVRPHPDLVPDEDPTGKPLWWAIRYVLSIPTNRVLIVGSAFGYFYLAGLETFAIEFFRGRYGLPQSTATLVVGVVGIGALLGVLIGGPVADRLIARGHLSARLLVSGIAFLAAAILLVPALAVNSLPAAVLFAFVAVLSLGAANPPLDAARLDIMHSRLWGRAESVRTVLRSVFAGAAPLIFGYVSTLFGGTSRSFDNGQNKAADTGLDQTFLLMLGVTFAAGMIILWGTRRRTYPRDVATAHAFEQATSRTAAEADNEQ